jgi:hypothetical protein
MQAIPQEYEEAARYLAEDHARSETTISDIWFFPDPERKVIRLVEVAEATMPVLNGDVQPVRFFASQDFPYLAEVALLSAEEWARVERGDLRLPSGWALAGARRLRGEDLR